MQDVRSGREAFDQAGCTPHLEGLALIGLPAQSLLHGPHVLRQGRRSLRNGELQYPGSGDSRQLGDSQVFGRRRAIRSHIHRRGDDGLKGDRLLHIRGRELPGHKLRGFLRHRWGQPLLDGESLSQLAGEHILGHGPAGRADRWIKKHRSDLVLARPHGLAVIRDLEGNIDRRGRRQNLYRMGADGEILSGREGLIRSVSLESTTDLIRLDSSYKLIRGLARLVREIQQPGLERVRVDDACAAVIAERFVVNSVGPDGCEQRLLQLSKLGLRQDVPGRLQLLDRDVQHLQRRPRLAFGVLHVDSGLLNGLLDGFYLCRLINIRRLEIFRHVPNVALSIIRILQLDQGHQVLGHDLRGLDLVAQRGVRDDDVHDEGRLTLVT